MKYIILILATIVLAMAASCSKTYTCECTYYNGVDTDTTYFEYEGTKSSAEESCKTQEDEYKKTDANATCELDA